jgi:hypothetical protein
MPRRASLLIPCIWLAGAAAYHALPVYVVDSRFTANACSNGGALSSIGVSWTVLNSRFTGGAIFFVSNDRSGTMAIRHSTLQRNHNDRFQTAGLPGIFFLGARRPTVETSVLR